ncbi:MAG: hypothetical protein DVB27_01975 [Verrucomicrobia bacterium]|nr:MAG: hypothetical protein DVB27_01975 [Verrucomicrobiota bacterium]
MKVLLLAVFALLSVVPARALTAAEQRLQLEGFPLVPPSVLPVKREIPGLKFPVFFAPSKDGFAPNLNFVDESFDAEWDAYLNATLENIKTGLKAEILTPAAVFELPSKLRCTRIVYRSAVTGQPVRGTCYLIQLTPPKAVVITFSSLPAEGNKWDAPIAESIRTFAPAPAPAQK